jgi:acetyl esterase
MRFLLLPLLAFATAFPAQAQTQKTYPPKIDGAEVFVYRTVGDVKLNAYVFGADAEAETLRPAVVFFFGGGWANGSPTQFEQHSRYLASRGLVAITCDYRVLSRHGTPAKECVTDAKAAIRWVRENAAKLGVDPDRVAAGGGSAGGHIAACTGVIDGFESEGENSNISSRPNALILYNPALVLAPFGEDNPELQSREAEMRKRMGVDPKALSPIHHVQAHEPPTIIFHGEADTTVPFVTARDFTTAMEKAGNRCELKAYPDAGHGFFNAGRVGNKAFLSTLNETDEFLQSLGWLTGSATVETFFPRP